MSKALVKQEQSKTKGVVPAVASAFIPGLGQVINGQAEKGIGVFVVSTVAGLGLIKALPLIGPVAAVVAGGTWVYGIVDGYITARRKKR
jgi:TM2 domain-containing membrane protein YozV